MLKWVSLHGKLHIFSSVQSLIVFSRNRWYSEVQKDQFFRNYTNIHRPMTSFLYSEIKTQQESILTISVLVSSEMLIDQLCVVLFHEWCLQYR